MKKFLLNIILLLMVSCSSITMYNGKANLNDSSMIKNDQWHHTFVFSLLEYSDPADLSKMCGTGFEWVTAESRRGPLQVITDLVLGAVNLSAIYSPWEVRVQCRKVSQN